MGAIDRNLNLDLSPNYNRVREENLDLYENGAGDRDLELRARSSLAARRPR